MDLDQMGEGVSGRRPRIPTFIDGFDEHMDGGIPAGSVVLVAGTAGTMKSSVTFHVLYQNAIRHARKGLYVSLEQNRASILDHMGGLGMDIRTIEDHVNIWDLGLIRSTLVEGRTWLEIFKKDIEEYREKVGLDLLVIDSLPVMDLIAKFQDPRSEIFHLFEWFRELGITTFLISEMTEGSMAYCTNYEDFLSDGILLLRMVEIDDVTVQRRVRCVKMRSSNHSMNYFNLNFEARKFQVTRIISKAMT